MTWFGWVSLEAGIINITAIMLQAVVQTAALRRALIALQPDPTPRTP